MSSFDRQPAGAISIPVPARVDGLPQAGPRRRVLIISNPAAGPRRSLRLRRVAAHLVGLGATLSLRETTRRGDAEAFAATASARRFDVVAVGGGDGTINEVLNGLPAHAPPLAVIPLGTANVLALEIGLSLQPREIARSIVAGPVRPIFLGRANGRRFVMMVGIGFDAEVVRHIGPRLKHLAGRGAYVAHSLLAAVRFPPRRYAVAIDGVDHVAWAPGAGVWLSFHIDGLSLLFALMISGTGALVGLYASAYLAGHRYYGRFFVYLFAFMIAMLGLVAADNVITLFVFWELTSVTSFLLIGLDHDNPGARRNALQALLVTGAGGLALLAGLLLLAHAGGSLELSDLIGRGEQVRADPLYLSILILVLIGAFTKSAQVPFHF